MARTGAEYLAEADMIAKHATKIRKRDPAGAAALDKIAHDKVNSAIKRMKRRPRRRANAPA